MTIRSNSYRLSLTRIIIRDTLLLLLITGWILSITIPALRIFHTYFPQAARYTIGTATASVYTGLQTRARTFTNTLVTGNDTLFDDIPFHIKGHIAVDDVFDRFYFSDCQGMIGEAPYLLNGFLGLHRDSVELRGSLDIDTVSFKGFARAYPDPLLPIENVPVTHIPITVQCTIDGAYDYNTKAWPSYRLVVSTGKGPLELPEENISFSSFQTAFTANYNPAKRLRHVPFAQIVCKK